MLFIVDSYNLKLLLDAMIFYGRIDDLHLLVLRRCVAAGCGTALPLPVRSQGSLRAGALTSAGAASQRYYYNITILYTQVTGHRTTRAASYIRIL